MWVPKIFKKESPSETKEGFFLFKDKSSGEIGFLDKFKKFIHISGFSTTIIEALNNANSPSVTNTFVTQNDVSTFDDVVIKDTYEDFPLIGVTDTLYITKDGSLGYWWDTTLNDYRLLNDPNFISPTLVETGTIYYADIATSTKLKPCTYNNGTAGVGATLTGNANGQLSQNNQTNKIDNVTTSLTTTPIVLVKDQIDATQNGFYQITQLGDGSNPFILTRALNYDETVEIYPSTIVVNQGQLNGLRTFYETTIDPIIGTDDILYAKVPTTTDVKPLLSVKTVLDGNLTGTYINSTAYVNLPGYGATITGTGNGDINSVENTNGQTLISGDRILVVGQTDNTQNGDYTLTRVGDATISYQLTRIGYIDSNLNPKERQWIVEGENSTYRGSIYSVDSGTIVNAQIGITQPLVFTKINPNPIGGVEQYLEVNISRSEILDMGNNPIELLPAPGPGKYYHGRILLEYTHNGTAYLLGVDLALNGTGDQYITKNIITDFGNQSSLIILGAPTYLDSAPEYVKSGVLPLNEAVTLTTYDNSNPTLGNGEILAKIWYKIETFGTNL